MRPLYESDRSAKGVAASATVLLASIEPRRSCPTSSIQRSKLCPVLRYGAGIPPAATSSHLLQLIAQNGVLVLENTGFHDHLAGRARPRTTLF